MHVCKYHIQYSLIEHVCTMGSTQQVFHFTHMHVNARLMTSNISFKALVYALEVCMTVCRCIHACQECTCQIWIMCMQTVSQGQRNKLYEHVHVLRCDSPRDTRRKFH